MNWPGISTILASQGQQHRSTRGLAEELSVDYAALMRGPTVLIYPVPVDIPTLVIVVTRGKGGDASSLVQLRSARIKA